jgi:hypothetical protein
MASILKQLLFSNEKSSKQQPSTKSSKASRRNSEIVATFHDLIDEENNENNLGIVQSQRDRRHSIPETGINSSSTREFQTLDTILEVCYFVIK